MKLDIFIAYHKAKTIASNEYLTPIQVGRALKNELIPGMIGDDTGENISALNATYNEMTAIYWAWKNCTADYIGLFHYRRFLNLSGKQECNFEVKDGCFTDNALSSMGLGSSASLDWIPDYDIVLPYEFGDRTLWRLASDDPIVFDTKKQYAYWHHVEHYELMEDVIRCEHPDYIEDLEVVTRQTQMYFCNMFIMKRELLDEYARWVFPIMDELAARIDTPNDPYQSRAVAFLAERLFNVFIRHKKRTKNIRIKECDTIYVPEHVLAKESIFPRLKRKVSIVSYKIVYRLLRNFIEMPSVTQLQEMYGLYNIRSKIGNYIQYLHAETEKLEHENLRLREENDRLMQEKTNVCDLPEEISFAKAKNDENIAA